MSAKGTAATKKSASVGVVPTQAKKVKPKLVDAVIANPAPVNAAVSGVVADIAKGKKLCRKCNTVKDLADFASDRSAKDGRYSQCKQCEADWRVARKAATVQPVAVTAKPAPKGKKAKK